MNADKQMPGAVGKMRDIQRGKFIGQQFPHRACSFCRRQGDGNNHSETAGRVQQLRRPFNKISVQISRCRGKFTQGVFYFGKFHIRRIADDDIKAAAFYDIVKFGTPMKRFMSFLPFLQIFVRQIVVCRNLNAVMHRAI